VIIEGVETPEKLTFLIEQQGDKAQGYKSSRPIPAEQFEMLHRSEQRIQASKSNGRKGDPGRLPARRNQDAMKQ
jgi:sensor c-di-GMP phosphodiesterase-like protein